MKKRSKSVAEPGPDDILPEYDFSKGERNRYAERFKAGAVAVVLDPDVAEKFPSARAVNEALRSINKPPGKSSAKRSGRRRTA
jgi:hypothetical protein